VVNRAKYYEKKNMETFTDFFGIRKHQRLIPRGEQCVCEIHSIVVIHHQFTVEEGYI
jgi:hypothetical protein